MNKNSVWHKDVFANKRSKTIFLIILGIILVSLSILIWANQTGRIGLWANADTVTNPICKSGTYGSICITSYCRQNGTNQADNILVNYTTIVPKPSEYWLEKYENGKWVGQTKNYTTINNSSFRYSVDIGTPKSTKYRVVGYQFGRTQCAGSESCTHVIAEATSTSACSSTNPTTTSTTNPTSTTCTNECTQGDSNYPLNIKCINNTQYQSCRLVNGCYKWDGPYTCSDPSRPQCDTQKGCYGSATPTTTTPTTTTPTTTTPTTTTPTQNYSIDLSLDRSECVGDIGEQINYLSWTGENSATIELYMESPNTNGFIPLHAASGSTTNHQYPSINGVKYKAINYFDSSVTDTVDAPSLGCSNVSPTPSYTISTPTAPTNVTAQGTSNTEIKLTWDAALESGEGYYNIYNADNNILIATVESSNTTWTAKGLKCNTEYSYYVTAGIGNEESNPSSTASATTTACQTGSDISNEKPENISLTYHGDGLATLSWDAVEGATGYDIYNCNGDYIHSTDSTSANFSGLSCGQTLCYYVVAHNDSSQSQPSDKINVDTESCATVSNTVTSLVSTGASLWFNILLALVITGCVGYIIFRREIHNNS